MKKVPAHSYSTLSTFEQCPHKYFRLKIRKDVKEDFSGEAVEWGKKVHKQLENFFNLNIPLSGDVARFQPYAATLKAVPGMQLIEHKVALNEDLEVVPFFDNSQAAYRAVFDYVALQDDRALIIDHKGLDVDTEIPTPSGFVRMGDLSVGDEVFDKDGRVCRVTDKSNVKHIPCYRVDFNDGSSVVCDEEHLWYTDTGDVVGVTALTGRQGKHQRYDVPRIPVCGPVDYPDVDLPVHPYVLGVWLADGKHSSGEISNPDMGVWGHIESLGYKVNRTPQNGCPTWTVQGIRKGLVDLGLLGRKAKRIPRMYLQANTAQRMQLLHGLMDGDGSANPTRKQCIYCTTSLDLAEDVQELLCSLGQQPYISSAKASGFGVETVAHNVFFRPRDICPFLASQKVSRVGDWGAGRSGFRRARSVEQVPIRPTQCIAVDSPSNTYLCTRKMLVTHNTGKIRPTKQLHFAALVAWGAFPNVDEIKAAFYWLPHSTHTKYSFRREQEDEMWQEFEPTMDAIAEAVETNVWPYRPSPLCRWCPVKDCPHNES